ncbi:hypothetical protein U1Q18_029925 [Sarracenia purpurea var. burkii]
MGEEKRRRDIVRRAVLEKVQKSEIRPSISEGERGNRSEEKIDRREEIDLVLSRCEFRNRPSSGLCLPVTTPPPHRRHTVATVVQVLYYEQQHLRDVMNGGESSALPLKASLYTPNFHSISYEPSILKRESQDLKLELLKMKMKLKEFEKQTDKSASGSPARSTPSSAKPPLPRKSFINLVSRKLGRLSPFLRVDGITSSFSKGWTKPSKDCGEGVATAAR